MPHKRLMLVAPSAYPLGGVGTWLDYIVPGLRLAGWDIVVALTAGIHHDVSTYLRLHPLDGVISIGNQTGTREGRLRSLCSAFVTVDPDIVCCVNIADVYRAVNRLRLNGTSNARVVMGLHGMGATYYDELKGNNAIIDALVGTNRLCCRLATVAGQLPQERVYYAPCGVPLPNRAAHTVNSRPHDRHRIAFVGRFDRTQKRVQDLVAIVHELERRSYAYELVLAGSGPDEGWLRDELQAAVVKGSTKMLGPVSLEELHRSVYPVVDVLLITSFWENGPIVAWEAMAHNVPVVTSAYIGLAAEGSLRHGENCLIFPVGDACAAADCLMQLSNDTLRQRLCAHGLALLMDKYSEQASIRQWDQCLSEIIEKPCRPGVPDLALEPAGRLDRVFGTQLAETVRRMLGSRQNLADAGAEWPHISRESSPLAFDFWETARAADQATA